MFYIIFDFISLVPHDVILSCFVLSILKVKIHLTDDDESCIDGSYLLAAPLYRIFVMQYVLLFKPEGTPSSVIECE